MVWVKHRLVVVRDNGRYRSSTDQASRNEPKHFRLLGGSIARQHKWRPASQALLVDCDRTFTIDSGASEERRSFSGFSRELTGWALGANDNNRHAFFLAPESECLN